MRGLIFFRVENAGSAAEQGGASVFVNGRLDAFFGGDEPGAVGIFAPASAEDGIPELGRVNDLGRRVTVRAIHGLTDWLPFESLRATLSFAEGLMG